MIRAKAMQVGELFLLAFVVYAVFKQPVHSGHVARGLLADFVSAMHQVSLFFDALLG